jgi:thioredoxin-related protein
MKWMQSIHRMILFTILIAVAAPLVAQDAIPWITDLRQAREVAERQNRLVLLHFWSDDCAPCKQLERNVFSRPEFIRALTTGYVPVKINANQQRQLAEFYNIERVPTDVIVTPEGREVQRFQSLQDSNQYIAMLDGIRAQASVGAYTPVSPNTSPAATRPQQETVSTSPYGTASPLQVEQSRYGQGGYGQTPSAPSASSNASSTPIYSQNRYSNPLAEPTAPQQQELAPRYANPYAQDAPANSNTSGSRWGQPASGQAANGASLAQQSPAPQANVYAQPGATSPGAGPNWQQGSGATQPPAAQNQGSYGQPMQNPSAGTASQQPRPNGGSQVQPSIPPAQPTSTEPQISLEGYCPVTLVQNRVWTPGDKKWGAVHEGRVYLFAGPEQQQQFLANPHVYAPLMAGYDPVRFAETGQLVPGRREFGLYIDEPGPIALFADEAALERFHANSNYYFNVIRQAKTTQAGRTTR